MMLRGVLSAGGDAIGCEECYEQLDKCADLLQAGKPFEEVYPQVKQHLAGCFCCGAEFEALLTALKTLPTSEEEPAAR